MTTVDDPEYCREKIWRKSVDEMQCIGYSSLQGHLNIFKNLLSLPLHRKRLLDTHFIITIVDTAPSKDRIWPTDCVSFSLYFQSIVNGVFCLYWNKVFNSFPKEKMYLIKRETNTHLRAWLKSVILRGLCNRSRVCLMLIKFCRCGAAWLSLFAVSSIRQSKTIQFSIVIVCIWEVFPVLECRWAVITNLSWKKNTDVARATKIEMNKLGKQRRNGAINQLTNSYHFRWSKEEKKTILSSFNLLNDESRRTFRHVLADRLWADIRYVFSWLGRQLCVRVLGW